MGAATQEREQLTFEVGGKTPDGSSLRVVGGRIEIEGQFEKGDMLKIEMLVEVRAVEFVDEVDKKTNQVVGCERRHKASPVRPPSVRSAGEEDLGG